MQHFGHGLAPSVELAWAKCRQSSLSDSSSVLFMQRQRIAPIRDSLLYRDSGWISDQPEGEDRRLKHPRVLLPEPSRRSSASSDQHLPPDCRPRRRRREGHPSLKTREAMTERFACVLTMALPTLVTVAPLQATGMPSHQRLSGHRGRSLQPCDARCRSEPAR